MAPPTVNPALPTAVNAPAAQAAPASVVDKATGQVVLTDQTSFKPKTAFDAWMSVPENRALAVTMVDEMVAQHVDVKEAKMRVIALVLGQAEPPVTDLGKLPDGASARLQLPSREKVKAAFPAVLAEAPALAPKAAPQAIDSAGAQALGAGLDTKSAPPPPKLEDPGSLDAMQTQLKAA